MSFRRFMDKLSRKDDEEEKKDDEKEKKKEDAQGKKAKIEGEQKSKSKEDKIVEVISEFIGVKEICQLISQYCQDYQLFFGGGQLASGAGSNACFHFNIYEKQWYTAPRYPFNGSDYATVAVKDDIYIFGGWNFDLSNYMDVSFVLKPGQEWKEIPPLPSRRVASSACAIDNEIYHFGGMTSGGVTDACEKFSIKDNEWIPLAPMKQAREAFSLAVFQNKVYIFAGSRSHSNEGLIKTCEVYDVETNTWKSLPDIASARRHAKAVVYGDKIHIFGGWSDGEEDEKAQFCFDPVTEKWLDVKTSGLPPLPCEVSSRGLMSDGLYCYAVGEEAIYVLKEGGTPGQLSWQLLVSLPARHMYFVGTCLSGL